MTTMPPNGSGHPGEGGGPPHPQDARHTEPAATIATSTRQPTAYQWAARYQRRSTAMLDCGHYADPHVGCRRCEPAPVTDVQAGGAVAAIEHLDAHGYPGLADYRTCRGMWRIGQRALAVAVHRRTSGEVA
ncbi:hypothetical protein [Mycobacterium kansasii]|nr:hypothetical protein [Mycobacterium kansasii]